MTRKFTRIGFSIQIGDDLSGCKFSLHLDTAGSSVTSEYLVPQTICWDTSTGTIGYITDNNWALTFEKTPTQMTLKITASDTPSTGTVLYSFTDGGITSYIDDYVVPDDFGKIIYIARNSEQDLLKMMRRYPFFKFEKNRLTGIKYFYDIIYRLWSSILLLRTYRVTIVQPFYYTYSLGDTANFTLKSGFTRHKTNNVTITPACSIMGNILHFYDYADKSSNWGTGNINNTVFDTITFPRKKIAGKAHSFYEITNLYNTSFIAGISGGIKSLTVSNVSYSNPDKISFDVGVNAVQTADVYTHCNFWTMIKYKDIMR
jgi:hypothetical protein